MWCRVNALMLQPLNLVSAFYLLISCNYLFFLNHSFFSSFFFPLNSFSSLFLSHFLSTIGLIFSLLIIYFLIPSIVIFFSLYQSISSLLIIYFLPSSFLFFPPDHKFSSLLIINFLHSHHSFSSLLIIHFLHSLLIVFPPH